MASSSQYLIANSEVRVGANPEATIFPNLLEGDSLGHLLLMGARC